MQVPAEQLSELLRLLQVITSDDAEFDPELSSSEIMMVQRAAEVLMVRLGELLVALGEGQDISEALEQLCTDALPLIGALAAPEAIAPDEEDDEAGERYGFGVCLRGDCAEPCGQFGGCVR